RHGQQSQTRLFRRELRLASQKITLTDDHVAAGTETSPAGENAGDLELAVVDFDLLADVVAAKSPAIEWSKFPTRQRIDQHRPRLIEGAIDALLHVFFPKDDRCVRHAQRENRPRLSRLRASPRKHPDPQRRRSDNS